MTTILFVTRTGIADVGSGGKHRAYQVAHDLDAVGGPIHLFSLPDWWAAQPWVRRGLKRRLERWGLTQLWGRVSLENPYNLLASTPYTTKYFVPRQFYRDYEAQLKCLPKPIVCVLGDTRLARIIDINQGHGLLCFAAIIWSRLMQARSMRKRNGLFLQSPWTLPRSAECWHAPMNGCLFRAWKPV